MRAKRSLHRERSGRYTASEAVATRVGLDRVSERRALPDIEVTPLRLAQLELPEFHPEAPGRDTIYGFLVREADQCILVDTGVGNDSELIERLYRPDCVDLATALGEAGVAPRDVTAVVNSHLHFDHCGNNAAFPGVPIFVQRAELEAASQPHYTVEDWVRFPDAHYVPIEGRHALSAGVELVPTPGHTPGHQSVILRSGRGVDCIVAQAAYTAAEFQAFGATPSDALAGADPELEAFLASNATWSRESYSASLADLHGLQPRRAYFSHDRTIWTRST